MCDVITVSSFPFRSLCFVRRIFCRFFFFHSSSVRCCMWWQHKMFADVSVFFSAFVGRNLVNVSFLLCLVSFSLYFLFSFILFGLVCGYCVAIFLHLNIYGGTKCKLCAIIEFHEFLSSPGGYFTKFPPLFVYTYTNTHSTFTIFLFYVYPFSQFIQ